MKPDFPYKTVMDREVDGGMGDDEKDEIIDEVIKKLKDDSDFKDDLKGEKGDTGDSGSDGKDGDKGDTGDSGSDGSDGKDGEGVASGGDEGQVLVKKSGDDYDTDWVDPDELEDDS